MFGAMEFTQIGWRHSCIGAHVAAVHDSLFVMMMVVDYISGKANGKCISHMP